MQSSSSNKKGKELADRRAFLKGAAATGVGAAVVATSGRTLRAAPSDDKPTVYPDQDSSEVRWGFLIDLTRCIGCNACAVACKTENNVRLGTFRNGVIVHEMGTYPSVKRHFVPWLCNHCKNPPCMDGCPVEPVLASLTFPSGAKAEYWARATYQRPDGLVLIDQERCVGCGACVTRCPYQARYLDRAKPAGGNPTAKAADKCTLCIHRMENGVVPACVNTCQAEARMVGNLNDPSSAISQALAAAGANARVLVEAAGTEPMCFYIGLEDEAYASGEEPRREAGLQTQVPSN